MRRFEGRYPGDGHGQDDAIRQMRARAKAIGIGEFGDQDSKDWVSQRVAEADTILNSDGRAAWDCVRKELKSKGRLTADEVLALVG